MGKPTGFLEFTRELPIYEKPEDRLKHYNEFTTKPSEKLINNQAARCMDCGIPFCHNGCPLGNIIPEFNDAVYNKHWEVALNILVSTNNFPEFTGRICPAPCESACVLGINEPPVAIEFIEKTIIEMAFEKKLITPKPPLNRTGKKVAIVGSGPSGLAAASQLNKAGHQVLVFERAESPGGLLRYGIPDFKLEKKIVQRRIALMEAEGVAFRCNTEVGKDISVEALEKDFDVVILAIGSTVPRDLNIKGRNLNGISFAMDFLSQQNHRNANRQGTKNHLGLSIDPVTAEGKRVLVIGGGDTGSDCVGTSNRQGATSILQIEVMEKPPLQRAERTPWPNWPYMLRTSSSHEEGVERQWACSIEEFISDGDGQLAGIRLQKMDWKKDENGNPQWGVIHGTDKIIECDLALLAIGFVHPAKEGPIRDWNLEVDEQRGNIVTNQNYQSSNPNVFVAGDCRRGQSLVVWAISEGRECAYHVDKYLMGASQLERKDKQLSPSISY